MEEQQGCAFKTCGSLTARRHQFSFPSDAATRNEWIGRIRVARQDKDWTPSPSSFVCNLHIGPDDLISCGYYLSTLIPPNLKKSTIPKPFIRQYQNRKTQRVKPNSESRQIQVEAEKSARLVSEQHYVLLGFSFSAMVYFITKLREPKTALIVSKIQDELIDIIEQNQIRNHSSYLDSNKPAKTIESDNLCPIKIVDIRSLLQPGTGSSSNRTPMPILQTQSSVANVQRCSTGRNKNTYQNLNQVAPPLVQRQQSTNSKSTSTWDLAFITSLKSFASTSKSRNVHANISSVNPATHPEFSPNQSFESSPCASPEEPMYLSVSPGLDPCSDQPDSPEEDCEEIEIEAVADTEGDPINLEIIRSWAGPAPSGSEKSSEVSDKHEYKCPRCYRVVHSYTELTLHLSKHPPSEPLQRTKLSRRSKPDEPVQKYIVPGRQLAVPVTEPRFSLWEPVNAAYVPESEDDEVIEVDKPIDPAQIRIEHSYNASERHLRTLQHKKEQAETIHSCPTCSRVYGSKSTLRHHVQHKHINPKPRRERKIKIPDKFERHRKTRTCKTCGVVCVSGKDYTFHKAETRHDIQTCPTCAEEFSSSFKYSLHVKSHEPDTCQICPFCGKVFTFGPYLTRHIRITHEEVQKRRQCSQCDRVFRSSQDLRNHVSRVHEPIPKFKCSYCPSAFILRSYLRAHEDRHTGRNQKMCPYCGLMKFSNNIGIHIRSVHEGVRYKCKFCGDSIPPSMNYRTHLKLKHPEEEKSISTRLEAYTLFRVEPNSLPRKTRAYSQRGSAPRRPRPWKPHYKNKPGNEAEIKGQIVAESDPLSFDTRRECPICKLKYAQLERHILVHSTSRSYQCKFCDYRGNSYSALYAHTRFLHLTVRKYKQPYKVKNRRLIRVGEAEERDKLSGIKQISISLNADVENETFPDISALRNCPFADCEERFEDSKGLRTHFSTAHPDFKGWGSKKALEPASDVPVIEERTSCPICGKPVGYHNMKRHLEGVHGGSRPFHCDVCNKPYSCKSALELHQTTISHRKMERKTQGLDEDTNSESDD